MDRVRADDTLTSDKRIWFRVFGAVARRPRLWPSAARQWRRSVAARWWRRAPFLPVPDRAYIRFRLETAYGLVGSPRPDDIVRYLEWCRATERLHHEHAEGSRPAKAPETG